MNAGDTTSQASADGAVAAPDLSLKESAAGSAGSGRKLISGAAWTMAGYGSGQIVRFATSLALTRILAPELFGIMLIVNTVRTGAELLSDIGIGQSVIRSRHGEQPAFYNTAWTLQIWRGLILCAVCALLSIPIAAIYDLPVLRYLLPAAGLTLLISGFTSMSLPLLRRRMKFARLALLEVATAVAFSVSQIAIAYAYPSVWALVVGLIISSLLTVAGSLIVAKVKLEFRTNPKHLSEIISFGKWITAASAIFFVTANLDRIYFPSVLSLEVLGVFAIARTITDVVNNVFIRLNNSILFPHIASQAERPREVLRQDVVTTRSRFLFASAVVVGMLAASVDLLVAMVFDPRYHEAGWMASVLMFGAWFAILASMAEASLLGLGRPQAATFANSAKLVWLIVLLPIAMGTHGMVAAITAISASDAVRYIATVREQRRSCFSFLLQDVAATAVFTTVAGSVVLLRFLLGHPFFG
jgi:O-antigen/teichoic acid export membrane protein